MKFLPTHALERKMVYRNFLAWWLPAARNQSDTISVHRGLVTDFKKTDVHHVCVNKKGEVIDFSEI